MKKWMEWIEEIKGGVLEESVVFEIIDCLGFRLLFAVKMYSNRSVHTS